MATKPEILDDAIEVLRRGEPFAIDAVAREAGLTKPGVMHHFATKEALVLAVVDRIVERWLTVLRERAGEDSSPTERLRAYVEYAVTGEFDQSDLALLVDVRLRDMLAAQWTRRMNPWFGTEITGTPRQRGALRAARLLADGAWFNKGLGIPTVRGDEEDAVYSVAMRLLEEGGAK